MDDFTDISPQLWTAYFQLSLTSPVDMSYNERYQDPCIIAVRYANIFMLVCAITVQKYPFDQVCI